MEPRTILDYRTQGLRGSGSGMVARVVGGMAATLALTSAAVLFVNHAGPGLETASQCLLMGDAAAWIFGWLLTMVLGKELTNVEIAWLFLSSSACGIVALLLLMMAS